MADAYTELYYHLVWGTKNRENMLMPAVEEVVFQYLRHKCAELKIGVVALNAMPDHVHLACTLPPTLCVSDVLRLLKGGSAHAVNQAGGSRETVCWQPGYGALTFSSRNLSAVARYIANQKTHHASGTLSAKMERLGIIADDALDKEVSVSERLAHN